MCIRDSEYFYKKTQVKGQRGDRHHKDYNMTYPLPEKIKATTPVEARRKYKEKMENDFNFDNYEHFSETTKITIESVTEYWKPDVQDPADEAMTAAKPTKYHSFRLMTS